MTCSRDVILLPSYAEVVAWRERAAREGGAASFGVEVATASAWVADLWELFGDGRTLATRMQRDMAIRLAGEGASVEGEALSAGMVDLVARVLEGASGLAEFEGALSDAGACTTLSPEEREVLGIAARARDLLDRMGAVESGSAMALLSRMIEAADGGTMRVADKVVLHALPHASLQQTRFLEALAQAGTISSFEIVDAPSSIDEAAGRLAPAGEANSRADAPAAIRFAFPSGRYAEPRLVADIVHEAAAKGRVVVCSRDPLALFGRIAPALAREGLATAVRANRRFADTDFGRAWCSLYRCVHDEDATVTDVTDALLSPFSGFSVAQAQDLDAQMRGNRLMTVEGCLSQVAAASDAFARLVDVATDVESDIVLGAVEDAVWRIPGATDAYRREQVGAIGALRRAMQAAREACAAAGRGDAFEAMTLVERELARTTVTVSREALPADEGGSARVGWDVLVAGEHDAASLGAGSCAAVVLCDMTSAACPAADKGDAAASLLGKIGLAAHDVRPASDVLARQRATLCALMAVPTGELVVERRLFDENAEPTYPAAVVQELVDCFRADPTAADDIDNPFSLPPALRAGMLQRGEEPLYENAAVAHGAQPVVGTVVAAPFGHVDSANRDRIVLPREGRGGRIDYDPVLSPSQIESYLECPYKWFAQRRLRLDELDAGFGPIEMGEYAHHAFEAFYRTFQEETGARKVTEETLDQARAIMRGILAEPSTHLVAATELERRDLEALKRRIAAFLDFEVQLLPGFAPEFLEFDIPQEARVVYAGAGLLGRVDRIDSDAEGRLVIIDYKSSVSRDYDLYAKDADYPRKVQALAYAQAVSRLTGRPVVGAIYVSYGRVPQIAGAFDPDAIAESQLPAMRHDLCRPRAAEGETYQDVLDATEARVAAAIGRMLAGDVAPCPLTDNVCTWCPVQACPERRG